MDVQITVRSALLGRVRWEVPTLVDKPAACSYVQMALVRADGVEAVSANPTTGRVLLIFDPRRSHGSFELLLRRSLEEALRNPPATLVAPDAHSLVRLLALTHKHR